MTNQPPNWLPIAKRARLEVTLELRMSSAAQEVRQGPRAMFPCRHHLWVRAERAGAGDADPKPDRHDRGLSVAAAGPAFGAMKPSLSDAALDLAPQRITRRAGAARDVHVGWDRRRAADPCRRGVGIESGGRPAGVVRGARGARCIVAIARALSSPDMGQGSARHRPGYRPASRSCATAGRDQSVVTPRPSDGPRAVPPRRRPPPRTARGHPRRG